MVLRIRTVDDADLDAIFEMMRDGVSMRMAAFTSPDPDDRDAFDAHMVKIRSSADAAMYSIIDDDQFVGTVGSFTVAGEREVTYWVVREAWGRGVATAALRLLLERDAVRPIFGRAASANVASRKVLERLGFVEVGRNVDYSNAVGGQVEETIYRLDR